MPSRSSRMTCGIAAQKHPGACGKQKGNNENEEQEARKHAAKRERQEHEWHNCPPIDHGRGGNCRQPPRPPITGIAKQEGTTPVWMALKLGPSTFGVFEAFEDEAGRQAHINGPVGQSGLST